MSFEKKLGILQNKEDGNKYNNDHDNGKKEEHKINQGYK